MRASLSSNLALINNKIYVRISVCLSKHREQVEKDCCLTGKKEARSSISLFIFLVVWGEGKKEEKEQLILKA